MAHAVTDNSLEKSLLDSDVASTGEKQEGEKAAESSVSPWTNVKFDTSLECPVCMVADFGLKCVRAAADSLKNLITPSKKV